MKIIILVAAVLSYAYSHASILKSQSELVVKKSFAVCKGEGIRAYIYEGSSDIWAGVEGSGNILLIKGHESLGFYSAAISFDSDDYPIVASLELGLDVMISDEDFSYASIEHQESIYSVSCYLKIN